MAGSVSRIGGIWSALVLLGGAPNLAQEGALVLEQSAVDAGGLGVPRAGSADGCAQEPHDGTLEKALGFNANPNAANIVQRFSVPVPAGGTEWFLDDVCLTLTRNGSAGTSTFSFAVFRDEGGSPGDVLAFRAVAIALTAFPVNTLCLGDFAVALAGHDAIHVGLAWNPQQQNVFLAMDASPGTPAQVVSVRTSTTGPGGLAGWGNATAIDATFRAGAIGITLFESRPEWLTTQISTPVASGSELSPRLDFATATRLGGIAQAIHGGADLLGINVYQDAAANRAFFSLETPADHPAGGDLEKITKLLNGSRFLGDSILRWPNQPNRFFFTLVDGNRKLLLGLLDLPPAGVDGPVEIDWHDPGGNGTGSGGDEYSGADATVTSDYEVVVTAPRTDGKADVLMTTDQGQGEFQRAAQLSPNIVSGSQGALGPAIATIPVVGDVVDCLIISQAVSAVSFAVRSICGVPFDGPPTTLFTQNGTPHSRRARVLGPLRGPTPEQLVAASLPAPEAPWDALLVSQGNGTIEVRCLDYTAEAAASRAVAEPGRLELVGQQVLAGVPTGAAAEWAVLDTGNNLAPRFTLLRPSPGGGVLASTFGWRMDCDWELEGEEPVPGALLTGFTARRPDRDSPPTAGDADGSGAHDFTDVALLAMAGGPSGTSLPRQLVAGPPLALFERRVPRPCVSGAGAHCLSGGRFEVAVDWRRANGQIGVGRRVELTDDSGLFYFFDPANLELITKVLDRCGSQFDSHWVFTAGLTDVEYVLRVFDSATGRRRFYVNPLKTAALPVQDTSAFKPCPALADAGAASTSALPAWAREALAARRDGSVDRSRALASPSTLVPRADCTPGATTLCLAGGRFRVEVQWTRPNGSSGDGQSVELTGDTGAFWFFDAANIELLVKVLDRCGSQFDSFWVFAAGLTNVEVTLTVTDTETGASRTYENPLGQAFQPVQDTSAFETCP